MFNLSDNKRNHFQLKGKLAVGGYDWMWHSFTGTDELTGERKAFFIEFFMCNSELGGAEPVFGQLETNRRKGVRPSYLMVKAGAWGKDAAQLHAFAAWKDVALSPEKEFWISTGKYYLGEVGTYGEISVSEADAKAHPEWMSDAGEMKWNLSISKKVAFNAGYGAGKAARALNLFEMFWHAEGMKTEYEGFVIWNGRRFRVSPGDCYGYADKNWGSNFTSPWLWLSSCNLVSCRTGRKLANSVFDVGGGRPKAGPFVLDRKLLGAFYYEGEEYEFNFSKFWTRVTSDFSFTEEGDELVWKVDMRNGREHTRMVLEIRCRKDEMLLIRYEAPDGTMRHKRLWNGGTGYGKAWLYRKDSLVDEMDVANAGCEYGEFAE